MSASSSLPADVDRLRELHLLLGEVAGLVVREQLREDERGVERRAQLVAHVGEELATCTGSSARAPSAFSASTPWVLLQLVALVLQQLACSSSCELVCSSSACCASRRACDSFSAWLCSSSSSFADAQLFLLGLQLLGLALRLLQQLLEPRAIPRGAHGDAERFGDTLQQFPVGRLHRAEEAELHHRVHDAVGRRPAPR